MLSRIYYDVSLRYYWTNTDYKQIEITAGFFKKVSFQRKIFKLRPLRAKFACQFCLVWFSDLNSSIRCFKFWE